MTVQFRCNHVIRFDESSGRQVSCNQLLQAEEEHAGLRVRCPRCNHLTEIPRLLIPASEEIPVSAGQAAAQRDRIESDRAAANNQAYTRFDPRNRCPECGAILDENRRCPTCRFVTPTVQPDLRPVEQIPVKPAGFQLWFRQKLSGDFSFRRFATILHLLVGCFALAAALSTMLLNSHAALAVLGIIAVFVLTYSLVVMQTHRLFHKPATDLVFWQRWIWNGILFMARTMNWQAYDASLKGRKIIDLRGKQLGDRDLLTLKGLTECEVLDMEGTNITDNGLLTMHGLKRLRCLVLRRTYVTIEGVYRLQQALPRVWIWW